MLVQQTLLLLDPTPPPPPPFETESHFVAQASLELMILLPPPSECWVFRCISPHPALGSPLCPLPSHPFHPPCSVSLKHSYVLWPPTISPANLLTFCFLSRLDPQHLPPNLQPQTHSCSTVSLGEEGALPSFVEEALTSPESSGDRLPVGHLCGSEAGVGPALQG